jgi:AcrR family transcriptional regulator
VPRGTISRPQIVEAALRHISSEGFDQLTMRSLAADLDVAPMSLYRYIRDKDDLMDEVVEVLLRRSRPEPAKRGSWQHRVTVAADGLRLLLVTEPAALYVYLRHPVVTPAAITRMEKMLDVFRMAGFDEASTHEAYAIVQTYTIGFAALQASRKDWTPSQDASEVAIELAGFTKPQRFVSGLRLLLNGMAVAYL